MFTKLYVDKKFSNIFKKTSKLKDARKKNTKRLGLRFIVTRYRQTETRSPSNSGLWSIAPEFGQTQNSISSLFWQTKFDFLLSKQLRKGKQGRARTTDYHELHQNWYTHITRFPHYSDTILEVANYTIQVFIQQHIRRMSGLLEFH